MWDLRIDLRVHYTTCRSLAQRISEFMAKQDSFDLPASKADKLNDMVAAMIEQLEEVEALWGEVTNTERRCGPRRPQRWPPFEKLSKCCFD